MDKRKDGGPAFPVAFANDTGRNITWDGNVIPHGMHVHYLGMSLRDYFAGKAMTGCLPGDNVDPYERAQWAYRMADSMLKARDA